MKLLQDLTRFECVAFEDTPWVPSPAPSIERKLLERDGAEVARATSIVRYAPGCAFAEHGHELGEEFVVLAGTFCDEHGCYPADSYVRNPPGSRHRPFSSDGCTIFVKLRQFQLGDARRCVIALGASAQRQRPREAATVTRLHEFENERVSLLQLSAGATLTLDVSVGVTELFVLRGTLNIGTRPCHGWTWLRAAGQIPRLQAHAECAIWLRTRPRR